jgi:hypothetical protein
MDLDWTGFEAQSSPVQSNSITACGLGPDAMVSCPDADLWGLGVSYSMPSGFR